MAPAGTLAEADPPGSTFQSKDPAPRNTQAPTHPGLSLCSAYVPLICPPTHPPDHPHPTHLPATQLPAHHPPTLHPPSLAMPSPSVCLSILTWVCLPSLHPPSATRPPTGLSTHCGVGLAPAPTVRVSDGEGVALPGGTGDCTSGQTGPGRLCERSLTPVDHSPGPACRRSVWLPGGGGQALSPADWRADAKVPGSLPRGLGGHGVSMSVPQHSWRRGGLWERDHQGWHQWRQMAGSRAKTPPHSPVGPRVQEGRQEAVSRPSSHSPCPQARPGASTTPCRPASAPAPRA